MSFRCPEGCFLRLLVENFHVVTEVRQEFPEIIHGDAERRGVDVRMDVELFLVGQVPADEKFDRAGLIVYKSAGGHGTGRQAQIFHEPFRRREAQSLFTKEGRKFSEVRAPIVSYGDEKMPRTFFVGQKKILRLFSGNLAADDVGFFHGEHRRVLVDVVGDVEIFQDIIDISHDVMLPEPMSKVTFWETGTWTHSPE